MNEGVNGGERIIAHPRPVFRLPYNISRVGGFVQMRQMLLIYKNTKKNNITATILYQIITN